jgi:hypothetical protein
MNPRRWLWLVVPALLAARAEDNDDLVRRANAAFHGGDYAAAVTLYEKAQVRSKAPGLVAFNLATASYHLARAGDSAALGSAEAAYRSCFEPGDPRRAEAFFGLGNCLLLRGGAARPDGLALRSAIDRYSECLREPGCGPSLAGDARANRERARLLLLQAPPAAGPEQEGGDDTKEDPRDGKRDGDRQRGAADLAPDHGDPGATEGKGAGDQRQARPSAGRGGLPPVPDHAEAPPLSSGDAAVHLDRAWRLIQDDLQAYRRGRARAVPPGARDW